MIIECPECTRPFELADDHIAALVQVECPSCRYRMILDFAAANDPSLRETAMKSTDHSFQETHGRPAGER